jgi:hypothetical protein
MNKYIGAFARLISAGLAITVLLLGTAMPAKAATIQDSISALSSSVTPLEDFSNLDLASQEQIIDYFKTNPVPASITNEIMRLVPPSKARATSYYNDLFYLAGQFLGCLTIASVADCTTANNDANTASSQAATLYPTTLHNGPGDAFRHCLWSALMTLDISWTVANKIGTKHETDATSPLAEKNMDLFNNAKGRYAGTNSITHNDAKVLCKSYTDSGVLQLAP